MSDTHDKDAAVADLAAQLSRLLIDTENPEVEVGSINIGPRGVRVTFDIYGVGEETLLNTTLRVAQNHPQRKAWDYWLMSRGAIRKVMRATAAQIAKTIIKGDSQ